MRNTKSIFLAAVFFFSLTAISAQQTATPKPSPTPPDESEVVKVTTNLIQVDAIVTDSKGRQVTDLKPEDFEIYQNGQKQDLTNFSYVTVTPDAATTNAATTEKPKPNANQTDKFLPPVPIKLKPEQVRRTIALVVDDLGLSFESTAFVRSALKKFVDEQMQANDLVAIVRTGGGIGALQSFTSDKRQLYAAIEKVRFNATGRAGVSAFAPIAASPLEQRANETGDQKDVDRAKEDKQSQLDFDNFRSDVFTVGTLGALNYIISGMRELPGRKAIMLLSDGFAINTRDADGNYDGDQSRRVLDALRRLTENANRASVVVNTIDARGLQTLGLSAEDDTGGLSNDQLQQKLDDRRNTLFDTQEGLNYLAQQTGGRAFRNNNDIKGSIAKVMDDQKGYYLLGYQPEETTFEKGKRGSNFNKLQIKITRPGLKIRYRSGFFGVTDEKLATARPENKQTAQQQLLNALTSPFGTNGVELHLNSLFGNDAKTGSYIRALMHVNAKDIKFTDAPDNTKKAVIDIVAYTFGDNGAVIETVAKTYTLPIKNADFQRLLDKGFVYSMNVPVKKPGGYQLRVALRDEGNEKIGAANQFIEVPNLKKNRLTLSGIILQNLTAVQYQKLLKGEKLDAETDAGAVDAQTDTALRRFKRNTILRYGVNVFNAKQPLQLTARMRIFQDGKIVFDGKPAPVQSNGQTDLQRLNFDGGITIPAQFPVGNYVLQVIVTDHAAKEKFNTTAQFVEFEVVN